MSTLYIRLPPRAVFDSAPNWLGWPCPFALVSGGDVIEREDVAALSNLSQTISRMQRVVLLLDGSDVTVLRVKTPPLAAAKLKAALPGLVEEQLLCDPAACVMVAGGLSDGLRTIAVVERDWLTLLSKTFIAFGARQLKVLPAQLCLPCQPGSVTAAINEWGDDIGMTLRCSGQASFGLLIGPPAQQKTEEPGQQNEAAASLAIQTLCAVAPATELTLYVPPSAVSAYQQAASNNERINIFADSWQHWIANSTSLDLMAGLNAGTGPKLDWRPWRWPLALAAAVLLVNVAALNIDWWRMKNESRALRTVMIQIYQAAYPKETIILDPLAQMQQKIAFANRDAGQVAADDFTALSAALGEAWASTVVAAGKSSAIAALEYRERKLLVRLKSGGEAPTQEMKSALANHGLTLELAPEQAGAVVWQIRSAK